MLDDADVAQKRSACFYQDDGRILIELSGGPPVVAYKPGAGRDPKRVAGPLALLLLFWLCDKRDRWLEVSKLRCAEDDAKDGSLARRLNRLKECQIPVETRRKADKHFARILPGSSLQVGLRHAGTEVLLVRNASETLSRLQELGLAIDDTDSIKGLVPVEVSVSLLLAIQDLYLPDLGKQNVLRPVVLSKLLGEFFQAREPLGLHNPFSFEAKQIRAASVIREPPRTVADAARLLAAEKLARSQRDFLHCDYLHGLLEAAQLPISDDSFSHLPAPSSSYTRRDSGDSLRSSVAVAGCWTEYLRYRYDEDAAATGLENTRLSLQLFLAQEARASTQYFDAVNLMCCIKRLQALDTLRRSRTEARRRGRSQRIAPNLASSAVKAVGNLEHEQIATIEEALLTNLPEQLQARLTNYGITLYQLSEEAIFLAKEAGDNVASDLQDNCFVRIEIACEALGIAVAMRDQVVPRREERWNSVYLLAAIRVWLQFKTPTERDGFDRQVLEQLHALNELAVAICVSIGEHQGAAKRSGAIIDLADEMLRLAQLHPKTFRQSQHLWNRLLADVSPDERLFTRISQFRRQRHKWIHRLRNIGYL